MVNLPVFARAGCECVWPAVGVFMENHAALSGCTGCEWDVVHGWVCAGGDAFDECMADGACPFGFEIGLEVEVNADFG